MNSHPDPHELDADARIDLLRRSQCWIGYGRARDALDRLDYLHHYGPGKLRPPNALLLGPTNNGKSMIVERFRRNHTPKSPEEADVETVPVVVVEMSTSPTVGRFYAELLRSLNDPRSFGQRLRVQDLEQAAIDTLRSVGTRVLVIDELHNMLAGAGRARREFLNLLRYLGNTLKIPLVAVGTQEAYLAVRTDPQLENRFEPIVLPVWEAGSGTAKVLLSYAATLPLQKTSHDLTRRDVLRSMVFRTGGTIGEMLALVRAAAETAIENGDEAITRSALDHAHYLGPTERRQTVEHGLLQNA